MTKNIILQHWVGAKPSWAVLAEKTMRLYASKIGADYELVTGYPLGEKHGPYTQKLIHLDEKYDAYDQVLMLDMDTIATNVNANVFDRPEIGVLHDRAMQGPYARMISRTPLGAPGLYKLGSHVFFGNFIKLKTEQRKELRKHLDWDLFAREVKDQYAGDEIILHYLLHKSDILNGKSYEDICMRTSGTSYQDIHFRSYNRYDKKFCNQPEDSEPDASIIHFCASRKAQLEGFVRSIFKPEDLAI